MAIKLGNAGVMKSGGAVVAEVVAWSYDDGVGIIEKPAVMGETAAVYMSDGRKTGTGSVEFLFDPADVGQGTFAAGATIVLEVHESGTAVGTVKHTGSIVIGSVSKAGGGAELLKRTCSFSGVLTEGVN